MKISRLPAFLPLIAVLLLQSACSGTSGTAPQSAAAAHEVGEEAFGTRILLASRDSDFKVEIARRIGEALRDEPVYVKFIGIKQLANEAGSDYTAIILMTRCTSWSMDPEAKAFLEKNPELSNIVLLITSGDGEWKPDMEGKKFDAITSASVMTHVDSVTEEILEKLRAIMRA